MIELSEGATSGTVLDALEQAGDLLALRRDGARLEVELRIDRDRRPQALGRVGALTEVEEARWQG